MSLDCACVSRHLEIMEVNLCGTNDLLDQCRLILY